MTTEILILLLAFQIKHLVADYYLQTPRMYENKGKKENWIDPLFDHSIVHGVGTFIIIFFYFIYSNNVEIYGPEYVTLLTMILVFFDFLSHFIIDRIKATRKSTIDTSQFWYNLGLDQAAHHIVGILIIFTITI